ncbi:MAG: serine/threonine protein kinase [Myxococcales bacterium]|nr:serine/threonine protein kinase [Myxococcales bacterium]
MSEKRAASMLEGKKLADRYVIEERVGSGGMAWLYRALDTETDAHVAIKILYEHMASQDKVRQRFEREASIQSQIEHPNVVRVLQMLEEDCVLGLVMEWMEGGDLQAYLERNPGPLPQEQVHQIFHDIVLGVQAAHEQDIVHRDLKPPNILLDKKTWPATARVTDFGIAKVLEVSNLTHTGSTMGTPLYIAPEQMLDSKTADQRADIYSLGVLLYRMCSGTLPFHDASSLLFKLMHEPPPPLLHLNEPSHNVLMRCLEKNPALRWNTCQELLQAFDKALDNAPLYNGLEPTDLALHHANEEKKHTQSLISPLSSPYASQPYMALQSSGNKHVLPTPVTTGGDNNKERISTAPTLDMKPFDAQELSAQSSSVSSEISTPSQSNAPAPLSSTSSAALPPPGARKTSLFAQPFQDTRDRLNAELPKPRYLLRLMVFLFLFSATSTGGLWYTYREQLWKDPQGTLTTAYVALSERALSFFPKQQPPPVIKRSLPKLPPAQATPAIDQEGWYRELPAPPTSMPTLSQSPPEWGKQSTAW